MKRYFTSLNARFLEIEHLSKIIEEEAWRDYEKSLKSKRKTISFSSFVFLCFSLFSLFGFFIFAIICYFDFMYWLLDAWFMKPVFLALPTGLWGFSDGKRKRNEQKKNLERLQQKYQDFNFIEIS